MIAKQLGFQTKMDYKCSSFENKELAVNRKLKVDEPKHANLKP